MKAIQTLRNKNIKVKKGRLFAGSLAAGVLSLSMGGAVGASSYGGGYGNNRGSSASFEQASYYRESVSSYTRVSCTYAQWRFDHNKGRYGWMSYNASSGIWYSCDYVSSYQRDVEAANYVRADYNNYGRRW